MKTQGKMTCFENTIRYLTLIIILFIAIFLVLPYMQQLLSLCKISCNLIPYYGAQFLFYFLLGIIIGFWDHFVPKLKTTGKWRINLLKLLAWGIPLVMISCANIFWAFPSRLAQNFIFLVIVQLGQDLIVASQVLLGYTIISCLEKHADS